MSDEAKGREAVCAGCIYYAGCDETRNACGYCATHCLCGAPPLRVLPPGEPVTPPTSGDQR